jgi:hypothetical protein
VAVATYHDFYGSFPPAYIADAQSKPMHSWRVLILPFLEQQELYDQYDFSEPWDGPNNRKLLSQRPSIYAFHDSESKQGTATNYVAVVGNETVWPRDKASSMDQIADGADCTLLVVENHGGNIPWTQPGDLDFATMNMHLAAGAADGVSSRFDPPAAVTADGSVHTLAMDMPAAMLRALFTARGGENVSVNSDWSEVPDARGRPLKHGE